MSPKNVTWSSLSKMTRLPLVWGSKITLDNNAGHYGLAGVGMGFLISRDKIIIECQARIRTGMNAWTAAFWVSRPNM